VGAEESASGEHNGNPRAEGYHAKCRRTRVRSGK
jgi:hypothetical protein